MLAAGLLLSLVTNAGPCSAATDSEKMKAVEEMFDSPFTEEMYYRTDRLLLTATGSMKPLHQAPAVATVITAEDIKRIGATNLDDVLETVPGLHVAPSPLSRLDSVYSIRGIHTSLNPQVLVLVNGIPVSQLFTGGRPYTFKLPVANISRVEIIRGPGSAVYGADAFAGVINVFTKEVMDIDGSEIGFRGGSFGFADTWLQHASSQAGWDIAFSMEYQKGDGDSKRIIDSDLQSAFDTVFSSSASLAPGSVENDFRILDTHLNLTKENWTFRFWSWMQDDGGLGPGGAQALDPTGRQDEKQFMADIIYNNNKMFSDLDFNIRLSHIYRKEDSFFRLFPPGAVLPIGADGNINFVAPAGLVTFTEGLFGNPILTDQQSGLELTSFYSGIKEHLVRVNLGGKYYKEDTKEFKNFGPGILDGTEGTVGGTLTDVTGTPYIFMQDQSRDLFYVSLQDEWSFTKNWELTAGIRWDHYSDFGDTVNPRVALVWETRYDLTTKLLYGEAFRPPSFSEQFAINNPAALGNPNLDPETIRTYELAFDYRPTNNLHTVLNVFAYSIKDLIEFIQNPGETTKTAQNSKNQEGYGFELEADLRVTDSLRIYGNIAYQRSKDKDTKEAVADAPGKQLYINPQWTFLPGWSLDTQLYWISDRKRTSTDMRSEISDYTLVNLILRRKNIIPHLDFALAINNVFNENIREPSSSSIPQDFPMNSRNIFGEFRYHF